MAVIDRLRNAWNAFVSNRSTVHDVSIVGTGSNYRPSRSMSRSGNERTILTSVLTRIAIDVASVEIRHVELDDQRRYKSDMNSKLNLAFTYQPNLDQGPRQFRQDVVQMLFDHGVVAIVPVDTTVDPELDSNFDIVSLRAGRIVHWYPHHVRVSVYNEDKGIQEEIVLDKRVVAIVENPLHNVINEPNSTFQRLIRKLSLLDVVDNASSSGKLDLIIQLPYVIKSEARALQAESRRKAMEDQLEGSKYGIAYSDATEKITQLNRPAENGLMAQIEFLTKLFYSQLGVTEAVMNGTAEEAEMNNYFYRTADPILKSIVEAMTMSFLGPSGVRKKEKIQYFRDPFKLVPVADIAEIADKFVRNEILTSNEIRSFMGIAPSDEPRADSLANPNMPQAPIDQEGLPATSSDTPAADDSGAAVTAAFDEIDSTLNSIFEDLGGA